MSNILIFKGTLNPTHNGHKNTVYQGQEEIGASRIIVAPRSNITSKKRVLPVEHRLNMSELAFEDNQEVDVVRFSLTTTTRKMIADIKRQNPHDNIYLMMGADAFLWLRTDMDVFKDLCNILVSAREELVPHDKLLAAVDKASFEYGIKIPVINPECTQTSSTFVRENIRDASLMKVALPHNVYNYILEHNLYGVNDDPAFGTDATSASETELELN